jgi:CRP-like cAMP-binding protein
MKRAGGDLEGGKKRMLGMLASLSFFDTFEEGEIKEFASFMSLQHVTEGTILFREGEVGEYLFFVIEGIVEIILTNEGTQSQIIATVGTGGTVGEMSLLDEYERSASVRAATDLEILILTKTKFTKVINEMPKLGVKVLQGLAKNISVRLRSSQGRYRDMV